jgi:hypothetical protein
LRKTALLVSSLLLGACTNMVRSEAPWFVPADAASAPPLRDGVWAAVDPECRFNANRTLEQWPGCAQGLVVRGGEELKLNSVAGEGDLDRSTRSEYEWSSEAFVLAAGAPRVHQRACGPFLARAEPAEDGAAVEARDEDASSATPAEGVDEWSAVDEAVSRPVYCYAGLRADAFDTDGRIVAFITWPIWCGPFPRRAEGEGGSNVTDAPFPGLTVVDEHCVAEDVATLRAAARASETLYPPDEPTKALGVARFRWIRDGWR